MTSAKCIQARQINATQNRATTTRRALRFVGTAIGEHEVVQEQVHQRLPPMEEICQFCQTVKRKDATANKCSHSRKVVLASLHDSPQEFKQLHEDPSSLIKVRPYHNNYDLGGHRLQITSGLTSNWQTLEKAAIVQFSRNNMSSCRYVATY